MSLKHLFISVIALSSIFQSKCAYNLVWSEEFNGPLDPKIWNIVDTNVVFNNELEAYSKNNVYVANGMLQLQARKEKYLGKSYTSGQLSTKTKKYFTHGKFEARMKLPVGTGFWPAFWLFPDWDDSNYNEIDIMEAIGIEPKTIHGNCYVGGDGDHPYSPGGGSYTLSESYDQNFHVFGVEWEVGVIRYFVDGNLYHSCSKTNSSAWKIDNRPMFIFLNLAIGGNWAKTPKSSTTFPNNMFVDWVRVYENSDNGNGNGNCASNTSNTSTLGKLQETSTIEDDQTSGKYSCKDYSGNPFRPNTVKYLWGINGKPDVIKIKAVDVEKFEDCCNLCGNTPNCSALKEVKYSEGIICILYRV